MDPTEPRWRVNTSFSPPPSRRWDPPHRRVTDVPLYGSSLSSTHSKESDLNSNLNLNLNSNLNHYHSVSDGALSYLGSPSENVNLQASRWTPTVHRFDLGEFSTPAGGSRPETSSYPRSTERPPHFTGGTSSIGSGSPFSESNSIQWAPHPAKPPLVSFPIPPRNTTTATTCLGRRSFMSKPVYPLVFRNPIVSSSSPDLDSSSLHPETISHTAGRATPSDAGASPAWPGGPDSSSCRDGFRWSNASSYDFAYDYTESASVDLATSDHVSTLSDHISIGASTRLCQRCGLCERPLSQKSPWSSNRIVRTGDMPVAGVLPCRHVFHADCLDETTPKSQAHDPPCPLCARPSCNDGLPGPFSEPLYVGPTSSEGGSGGASGSSGVLKRRGSLFKERFRKQFSFKGRDLFSGRVFKKSGSSSKNPRDDRGDHHRRFAGSRSSQK